MRGSELACIVGGGVMAVIAGTATASFGLAPADAALRAASEPPINASASTAPAEVTASPPAVATYVSYPWPAARGERHRRDPAAAEAREGGQPSADFDSASPVLVPAIDVTAAADAPTEDPPPDGDASPVGDQNGSEQPAFEPAPSP